MKAFLLLGCALFLGFMAMFALGAGGFAHTYAALAAAGSLLLSLK